MAQADRSAEKAVRRQQQQVQALQQQVSQAQAEKAKVEQDRAAIEKQLQGHSQAAARASAAQRAAAEKLKALETEKAQLTARVAELEKAAEAQRLASEQALAGKDRELAQAAVAFKGKEGERAEWQQRFGQQARLVTECSDKNERLLKVSAELLNRWRGKSVIDALRQAEPVLGLNDVQTFNLVQEYRDKAESERFIPSVERR
jgi:chromosome segregation ATPase